MPEILQLGPFTIRLSWLLWALSGLIGYIVMKYRLNRTAHHDSPVLDILASGLFIAAIVWKFSPLLFTPSILWESPLSILFISGSRTSVWIGAIAGMAYIGFKCWRMRDGRWLLPDLLSYGVTSMVVVYSLLSWQYGTPTNLPWGISIENPEFKYHPVNIYKFMVTLPLFIWLWRQKFGNLGSGRLFIDFITFYGTGLLLVSLFKPQTVWILGISREQFIYIALILVGSFISFKQRKKESLAEGVETK
jgi:prolipoprotein diacylglyceryltransferase